jgi:putative ABC transport system permease protein
VLNTIYHLDVSPGNIPYSLYEDLSTGRQLSEDGKKNPFRGMVAWAVPYAVGDSYQGRRIVATSPQLFGVDDQGHALPADRVPEYRKGRSYRFAAGRAFSPDRFEAVIGSEVARNAALKLGDTFHATHGFPGPNDIPDVHAETWTIVGVLAETHTANDRVLFIPLKTFYTIAEHESGLEKISEIQSGVPASSPAAAAAPAEDHEKKTYTSNPDGTIDVLLPRKEWEVSAVLVKTRSAYAALQMQFILRNKPDAIGVLPAQVMHNFFATFLPATTALMLINSTLVIIVAGVSILVSIYNSVAGRRREIAIMRALGATRRTILAAVCLEAGVIGLTGAVGGLLVGHLFAAGASVYIERLLGTSIPWWQLANEEWLFVAVALVVSLLAGLVPALKAYKTPVAENLVAS